MLLVMILNWQGLCYNMRDPGWLNADFLIKETMEESILYIKLVKRPTFGNGNSNKNSTVGDRGKKCEHNPFLQFDKNLLQQALL